MLRSHCCFCPAIMSCLRCRWKYAPGKTCSMPMVLTPHLYLPHRTPGHPPQEAPTETEHPQLIHRGWSFLLTSVDKASGSAFAELLRLVGEGHFNNSRDVSRRRLHSDGVGGYQLQKPHMNKCSAVQALRGGHLPVGYNYKMSTNWTIVSECSLLSPRDSGPMVL